MHDWGWTSFKFDWIIDTRHGDLHASSSPRVWQSSGFVMAMFLAGLRGIDSEIIKAAQIDGATPADDLPAHRHPAAAAGVPLGLRRCSPTSPSRAYDLVVALTDGGPGCSTELPAIFMYAFTFTRNQMAMGAASAVMMLMTVAAIIVPYLYSELRQREKRP